MQPLLSSQGQRKASGNSERVNFACQISCEDPMGKEGSPKHTRVSPASPFLVYQMRMLDQSALLSCD